MASLEQHCLECASIFGNDFKEVHMWLDEFFYSHGLKHRKFRHHLEGVEEVRRKWGDLAARAAEMHIMTDFRTSYVPSKKDVETIWWIFGS